MTLINLKRKLTREVDKGIRKLLAPKNVRELPPEWPDDFSDFSKELWRGVSPYTMTSKERVVSLESAVRYISAHEVAGDMVESGVAAGGSVMAMALTLLDLGKADRRLWLYDTFEGMPEPTKHDVGRFDTPAMKLYKKRQDREGGWIKFSVEDVERNVLSTGYPAEQVVCVKGKVENSLLEKVPERISLLRLDTDWYESTKSEMEILFPLVSPGGLILLDDYYRWMGSRKAVDEYIAQNGIRIFWSRIDDHSVMGLKQN
jgi:O-methyltransferase